MTTEKFLCPTQSTVKRVPWLRISRDLGVTKNTHEKIIAFSKLWVFADGMKQKLEE